MSVLTRRDSMIVKGSRRDRKRWEQIAGRGDRSQRKQAAPWSVFVHGALDGSDDDGNTNISAIRKDDCSYERRKISTLYNDGWEMNVTHTQ